MEPGVVAKHEGIGYLHHVNGILTMGSKGLHDAKFSVLDDAKPAVQVVNDKQIDRNHEQSPACATDGLRINSGHSPLGRSC